MRRSRRIFRLENRPDSPKWLPIVRFSLNSGMAAGF
jgi:hypothetical protein